MASLSYVALASSTADGPLVYGISGAQAAFLAATNPAALANYVNATLQAREAALPEQTRVELNITGWQVAGQSLAQYIAQQINSRWQAGSVRNLQTGMLVVPWPEYPQQIAWGDDATDTLTIRTEKAQPQLVWVLVGIAFVLAVVTVWGLLHNSKWAAQTASLVSGLGGFFSWVGTHPVEAAGIAAGVVLLPLGIRYYADVREAENAAQYARRGGT